MEATQLLKTDHEKVTQLFRRFNGGGGVTGLVRRMTGNVASSERQAALEGICRELTIHAAIEEEIFYPALRRTGDDELGRQVDEALREHGQVKRMVRSLEGRSADAEGVTEEVNALQECVDHHVNEEENEMFPRVHEVIGNRERAELGQQMRERKKALGGATPRPAQRARSARSTSARPASKTRVAKSRARKSPAAKRRSAKTSAAKTRATRLRAASRARKKKTSSRKRTRARR
jgi:hemerythrin superfamily protein